MNKLTTNTEPTIEEMKKFLENYFNGKKLEIIEGENFLIGNKGVEKNYKEIKNEILKSYLKKKGEEKKIDLLNLYNTLLLYEDTISIAGIMYDYKEVVEKIRNLEEEKEEKNKKNLENFLDFFYF